MRWSIRFASRTNDRLARLILRSSRRDDPTYDVRLPRPLQVGAAFNIQDWMFRLRRSLPRLPRMTAHRVSEYLVPTGRLGDDCPTGVMTMNQPTGESLHREVQSLTRNLQEYLAYQKELGVTELPVSRPPAPDAAVAGLPPPTPPTPQEVEGALGEIAARIAACSHCHLCKERANTVPGQGTPTPEVMFVGEGPGADEDKQGLAFVGRAGQLLTKMIEAMGFSREDVFIANIVKCRPPGNRAPTEDEMAACLPYLREQITWLRPKVIVALGATAVKGLVETRTGITKLRGTWLSFEGIDLMPTFHPAYLLRDASKKKYVWEDLQEVLRRIGREPPDR